MISKIAIPHSNHSFMVSTENSGFQWSIELIIIFLCCIVLQRKCLEVTFFLSENLLAFGNKIFETRHLLFTCTIICTSNKSWKHRKYKSGLEIVIWKKFLDAKWIFKSFSLNFNKIFWKLKIFKNNPQIWFFNRF